MLIIVHAVHRGLNLLSINVIIIIYYYIVVSVYNKRPSVVHTRKLLTQQNLLTAVALSGLLLPSIMYVKRCIIQTYFPILCIRISGISRPPSHHIQAILKS